MKNSAERVYTGWGKQLEQSERYEIGRGTINL